MEQTDTTAKLATKRDLEEKYSALVSNIDYLRQELRAYRDLLSDKTPIFTIGQVCKMANCSRPTFYNYWKEFKLQMPEPKTKSGQRPLYSQADILKLKQVLLLK